MMVDINDCQNERPLEKIIYDLHWMARRYADERSSYAPGLLNQHVKALISLGYILEEPLYARDGMGRQYDGLTEADVKAAEEDMPIAHKQNVTETDERIAAEISALNAQLQEAREILRFYWTEFDKLGGEASDSTDRRARAFLTKTEPEE